eukprot:m.11150 g.11150  ORF g.11150 m.11150 type:complete len:271 (+) comp2822_c0_seq1:88-900(+)
MSSEAGPAAAHPASGAAGPSNDFYSAGETGNSGASAGAAVDEIHLEMPGELGDMETPGGQRKPGQGVPASAVGGYLASAATKQGLGWMLELEDDDEDMQKPLLEELDINPGDIVHKLRCILLPVNMAGYDRSVVRDNPDFWGPLLVVFLYAMESLYGNWKATSWIITIWFVGSFLLFFLLRVMGGDVSFSSTLGVLGYSLLPLALLAGFIMPLVKTVAVIDVLVKVIGIAWSTQSAGSLLVTDNLMEKRSMLLYPIMLLYGYLLSLHTGA